MNKFITSVLQDGLADNIILARMKDEGEPAAKPATSSTGFSGYAPNTLNPAPQADEVGIEGRQGTTFVTEAPAAQPVVEAEPFSSEGDALATFGKLSAAPPPVYDETRERRLKTMAGASGVAKALMTLGDAFAVSKGGIVKPRQITRDPYVAQIMADEEAFANKDYAYKLKTHEDALRMASVMTAARVRDNEMKARAKSDADQLALQKAKLENDKAQQDRMYDLEVKGQADAKAKFDTDAEIRREGIKAGLTEAGMRIGGALSEAEIRAQAAAAKEDAKKPVITTPDGKMSIKLDNAGQIKDLYTIIMSDQELLKKLDPIKKVNMLKGNMSGVTATHMESIVREMWSQSDKAIKHLQGAGKLQAPAAPSTQGANSYMQYLGVQPAAGSTSKAPSMFQ